MYITKIPHYFRKCIDYGPRISLLILQDRIRSKLFDVYCRKAAQYRRASHSWNTIKKNHSNLNNFSAFLIQLKKRSCEIAQELLSYADNRNLEHRAHDLAFKCFDMLGSEKQCFTDIPWHTDFRLQKQNNFSDCTFDAACYYKDIHISCGQSEMLTKDIKIPWELHRLQHFFVFGQAYNETKNELYVQSFKQQFVDWQRKNPFLLGPAWSCPMDVGIRSVNLTLSFYLFCQSSTISDEFWQLYITTLYDHLYYLERNWEKYDYRTSNHYLSDLIGYFYLCYFFSDAAGIQEKLQWCYKELLQEFNKQVFPEGTDYEGSTCYHQLVTEIFYHFYLICKELQLPLSAHHIEKIKHMFTFIDLCTPHDGTLIQIGDNDSGKITYYGISSELVADMKKHDQQKQIQHFSQFGISIIKTYKWHITLRHHAYAKRQPSGHFHNDVGSITVAYAGIPLFIDPGSFVYTPSAVWRNKFRSVRTHNTFSIHGMEPVILDERLFAADIPEADIARKLDDSLYTEHALYASQGLLASRSILHDDYKIIVTDQWKSSEQKIVPTEWNFIIGPDVTVLCTNEGWLLQHPKAQFLITSDVLQFSCYDTWISLGYGSKILSKKLQAIQYVSVNTPIGINISKKTF